MWNYLPFKAWIITKLALSHGAYIRECISEILEKLEEIMQIFAIKFLEKFAPFVSQIFERQAH